jgi:hypothetical protein
VHNVAQNADVARVLSFAYRFFCVALFGAQVFFAAVAAQVVFSPEVSALPREHPRRVLAADLVGAMLARLDAGTIALTALAVVGWRAAHTNAAAPAPAIASSPIAPAPAEPPQTAIVAVSSNPVGAEVLDADGHRLGRTPMELTVAHGSAVRLVLRRDGYAPFQLARKSVGGDRVVLTATLKQEAKPKPRQGAANRPGGFRDDPY